MFSIGGELQDTLLQLPWLLAAGHGRVVLYDYADARLLSFDSAGDLEWAFGRHGHGPGEFVNALSLSIDPAGDVWVVDGGAGRLTVVSPGGTLRRILPLEGLAVRDVVPLGDTVLVTLVSPTDSLWVALDHGGGHVAHGPFPLDDIRTAPVLVRQPYASMDSRTRVWAMIYPLGDHLLVYEGTRLRCHGRLVEGGAFPEDPGPDAQVWAVAAAVDDSAVFVLPRGRTRHALGVLDEYSVRDCRYRRTHRLPRTFRAMALGDGVFYMQHEDPVPEVVALRPRQ